MLWEHIRIQYVLYPLEQEEIVADLTVPINSDERKTLDGYSMVQFNSMEGEEAQCLQKRDHLFSYWTETLF